MKQLRLYWRIIYPITVGLLIWHLSAEDSSASDATSLFYANFFGLPNYLVRKLAHFTIFAIFALSCTAFTRGLNAKKFPSYSQLSWPLLATIAYSVVDELHQLFVSGRSSQFTDVLIDTLGGCSGILLYVAVFCYIKTHLTKNSSTEPKKK